MSPLDPVSIQKKLEILYRTSSTKTNLPDYPFFPIFLNGFSSLSWIRFTKDHKTSLFDISREYFHNSLNENGQP